MSTPNPIRVRGIDHVVLRTTRLERLVRFYRDVLGCRLERGPGVMGLAQLRAGSSLIDLLRVDATGAGSANMDHVCLFVAPWEPRKIRAYLVEHGVSVGRIASRYGAAGMGPSLYIEDPDGNTVELKGPSPS